MEHSTLSGDYSGRWRVPVRPDIASLHGHFQRHLFYLALALGCHQRPDRSFCISGRQIPICARCLGMLIGPLFAPLYLWFPCPGIAAIAISAFLLDGFTQLAGGRESKNWIRFLTGAAFTASAVFLMIRGVTECLLNIKP